MKVDIIGDIHGCYDELKALTEKLGYEWQDGIPVHSDGRRLGFVGDLTDRGPHSLKVIELVWSLVIKHQQAYYCPGNHCNKLYRFFCGNKVEITHGLETTVAEYEALPSREQKFIKKKFIELYEQSPLYVQLDQNQLIIAHAGLKAKYIGRTDKKVKTFVLYGDITGEKHLNGMPVRRDWAQHYNGKPFIVYGHTPVVKARKIHNTINIDTGAVFGGALTAFQYPEGNIISVPSSMPYVEEKFNHFV